ncbi:MAG TPA: hypothetical protein VFJ02_14155 [Vicinamibacterales bacterium]|nr:hypothetical protein [Vicinamibacterales bacterium]
MPRPIVAALAFCMFVPVSAASAMQANAPQPPPPAGQKPKPAPTPSESPEAAAPHSPGRGGAQPINLRLELTITDQRGAAPATPKTVTMLVADRYLGRIRTSGNVRVGTNYLPIVLNVDAQPEVLKDGRVRVQVTLEYRAQTGEGTQEENQPSNLTESFSVILDDGKPMLVTQSADPGSDRRVKVEMKATQVK